MGIEAKSDVFDGVYATFSNIDAIEKVISTLAIGDYVTTWVYTNRQVNNFLEG